MVAREVIAEKTLNKMSQMSMFSLLVKKNVAFNL